MANAIAVDYGFTQTTSGEETTFEITKSQAYKSTEKIRMALWYVFLFIPSCGAGVATGKASGVLVTLVVFGVLVAATKFIGRFLRARVIKNTRKLVVTPTTFTCWKGTYNLKDSKDWRIENSRDGRYVSDAKTALVNDMMAKTSFEIKFNYGNEVITPAMNLSEPQANGLLEQIFATIEKYGKR